MLLWKERCHHRAVGRRFLEFHRAAVATGLQPDGAGLQRHRGRAVTRRHTPSDARVLAVGCRTKLISRGAARICANQDLPQPITKLRPTGPWALKLCILLHRCACLAQEMVTFGAPLGHQAMPLSAKAVRNRAPTCRAPMYQVGHIPSKKS